MTHLCLPIMAKNKYGRVINMSPPLQTDFRASSAWSSTSALGAAAEYEGGEGQAAQCLVIFLHKESSTPTL
eukprot:Skav212898  [mRNA]  locus=scaffold374:70626:72589:+ [translate_table: standard]